MFSVLFEIHPRSDQWDAYLGHAEMLRPELEQVEGFVGNIRYRSLNREGWILSLSSWENEKAVVRWRTRKRHHEVQELSRDEVLRDYHLRVGQIMQDTVLPEGFEIQEQRFDETDAGDGTTVVLIDAKRPAEWEGTTNSADCAEWLGLRPQDDFVTWDLFEAVLTPRDILLMIMFRDRAIADIFLGSVMLPDGARMRSIRIIRDYGMFDRREAPQYYPEVQPSEG